MRTTPLRPTPLVAHNRARVPYRLEPREEPLPPRPVVASRSRWRGLGLALAIVGITVAAALPRWLVAVQMAWLNDEVLFVDWLGTWFSQNGLAYIFQWQHTFYPPMSPVFANPPLFPLLVGGALDLAVTFHVATLLAARLISLVAGVLACGLVTWTGYRLGGIRSGILAGGLLAVLPVAVVASATAYVEGLLALEVAALLALLVEYRIAPRRGLVIAAAIVSGFGILTKLTFLPLVLGAVVVVALSGRGRKRCFANSALYLVLTVLVPVVCWSGARDPHHIAAVVDYVVSLRPNDGLTQTFPLAKRLVYYPILVVGTLPDILPGIAGLGLILAVWRLIRRRSIDAGLAVVGGLGLLYLGFITLAIGPSSRHQIAALEPLLAVGSARLVVLLLDLLPLDAARTLVALAILAGSAFPVLRIPAGELNAFSNDLVGGPWGSLDYYLSGDGEGIDQVGAWLNANTPPGSLVASVAQNYNLQKYLVGGRRVVPVFNNEPMEAAGARGASIVVLYTSQVWSGNETAVAASARAMAPRAVIDVAGAPDFLIYDLASAPRSRVALALTWTTFQHSPTGEVIRFQPGAEGDSVLQYEYLGPGLHWAGLLSSPFSLQGVDRIALHLDVQTSSDSRLIDLDLLPTDAKPGDPYRRYQLPLAPSLMQGPQVPLDLEIPLTMFRWVDPTGAPVAAPNDPGDRPYQLRVVGDAHGPASGRVEVGRVTAVTLTRTVVAKPSGG